MFFSVAFFFSNDQTILQWSHWRTLIFPLDVLLLVVTHVILCEDDCVDKGIISESQALSQQHLYRIIYFSFYICTFH